MKFGLPNNPLCWLRLGFFRHSSVLYIVTVLSKGSHFGYVFTYFLKITLLKAALHLNCAVDNLDRIHMRRKFPMYRRIIKLIE
jgi:hypothetical protein